MPIRLSVSTGSTATTSRGNRFLMFPPVACVVNRRGFAAIIRNVSRARTTDRPSEKSLPGGFSFRELGYVNVLTILKIGYNVVYDVEQRTYVNKKGLSDSLYFSSRYGFGLMWSRTYFWSTSIFLPGLKMPCGSKIFFTSSKSLYTSPPNIFSTY